MEPWNDIFRIVGDPVLQDHGRAVLVAPNVGEILQIAETEEISFSDWPQSNAPSLTHPIV
jgi:hypothetical protein